MTDAPNPSGSNDPQTTAEEVLGVMEPTDPYTTQEIADALDIPRRTANYRLNRMADDGEVRKKKHNKRRVSWMLPEGGGDA